MKNKILLTVLFALIGLFTFTGEAEATVRGKRTKKVVVVKKGPNRGRTVIIKKRRRGRTVIVTRNRNGRTVRTIPNNRRGRSCGTRVIRQRGCR